MVTAGEPGSPEEAPPPPGKLGGARCATHAEVAAVDVCQRCGRFLCGECVELVKDDAYCAECAARVNLPPAIRPKVALCIAAAGWCVLLAVGLLPRSTVLKLIAGLVPLPAAVTALVLAFLEWRKMKSGLASTGERRWLIGAFLVATPLLLLVVVAFVLAAAWSFARQN